MATRKNSKSNNHLEEAMALALKRFFCNYQRPSRKRSASNLGRDLGQFRPLKENIDCEF